MPSSAPQNRWQRRPTARPEEILNAALAEFIERGYAATKLDDIARRANISKGTLYLYFSNKESLFKQAVLSQIGPLIDVAELCAQSHQDSPLILLKQLYADWARILLDPTLGGLCKLMIAESDNFPDTAKFYVDEVVVRSRRVLHGVIERAMKAGELRVMPAELVVRELVTPILFMSLWRHSLAPFDPQHIPDADYLDTHWNIVMRGLSVNLSHDSLR
ncbi:MAG: TetR/AcrR family transcriptional regulator [Paraperlucidibaca sp.]